MFGIECVHLCFISDEKVHLANQMHDLVERYLRRLDQELHKFKMELEADNKGITEVLEKRNVLNRIFCDCLYVVLCYGVTGIFIQFWVLSM
jgi:hypothetical protein